MAKKKLSPKPSEKTPSNQKRTYISQADIPSVKLDEALRVPKAIVDNYARDPASPLQVAKALQLSPTSGGFKVLCGASLAYGLTEGGYGAQYITVTALARQILEPQAEDEEMTGRRQAVLAPRIIGDFLRKYSGSALPRPDIAGNVLQSMGVPKDRAEAVYKLIIEGAESVGFISKIKDKSYVDLAGVSQISTQQDSASAEADDATDSDASQVGHDLLKMKTAIAPLDMSQKSEVLKATPTNISSRRVFITHGKNQAFIEPIKKLLAFGELVPVVSVERQTVSKPVPEKVMDDMRSCGAAIIHVDEENKLMDDKADCHVIINSNVLIEIGAAMARYGRRFILLVKKGVTLPSNLQGLFEVRYDGDALDGNATIALLGSINDMKNEPMPDRNSPV